ncbi:MAG: tetratricopeptide repeat protein [Flavobacteriales bacterium]
MKYLRPFAVIHTVPVPPIRPYRPLLFATLALALLAASCSQEKDAFLNRTFHRLTARDNGWFNANEKLKEVVTGIEDAHVDDYDEVLPLFVYGTEEQAKAAIPDLEKCIEKCSTVIDRHSMDIKGKEKNTWIDDAWFVIAKSHFYRRNFYEAERGFAYIGKRFQDQNRQLESQIWTARTAIVLEQYGKAQSALDQVRDLKKIPKDLDLSELDAVYAELNLKRGKIDDAIMHLERAAPTAKRKRDRVRWSFVLAQLYERKGYEEKAIAQYGKVLKMSPTYEMAFHAQIMQALAFNKGDSKALRQKLNRMLKDQKHVDHFDMIHYALADLDLKERKKEEAMAHLRTSTQVSTTDTRQKAKSFLKLSDIYFEDRNYRSAQQYYDSTSALLSEEHARYDEVDTRARVLGKLVEQLEIIEREDSLQALAGLNEEDLEKKIRGIIREREKAEEDLRRKEEEASAADVPATAPRPAPGAPAGRGAWYFYDPQQLSRGLASFRKKWGNRPLEDDWRRKDKTVVLTDNPEEDGKEDGTETAEKDGEPAWKDPASYGKDIPRDLEGITASNERVCEALYVSGMIYKEQLKDRENAIESFEVLNNRFDECRYTPESHYQLYRIYLEKEAEGWVDLMGGSGSQTYANIILERWPTSEFARLVRDPNMLQADEVRRQQEEAAYRETYQLYRQYAYSSVISTCDRVIQDEPRNHFRSKYHILKALAKGGMRDMTGYRAALMDVKAQYAGTEEAQAADNLLAARDGAGTGGGGQGAPKPAPSGPVFTMSNEQHSYMIVFPNAGTNMASVKARLSDFVNTYMPGTPLQVTNSFLDTERQVVLLQPLPSKALAMEFHSLFTGDKSTLEGINDKGFPAYPITPENYAIVYKSKDIDAYATFFTQNYLGRQ